MAIIESIFDDELIYAKILDLYDTNPKFIQHVIRSNFPNCKTTRVISFNNQGLINRRCCISNRLLTDIEMVAKYKSKKDGLPYDTIVYALSDKRTLIQQIDVNAKGRTVALLGERSNRMICLQALNQLMLFIKHKVNIESDELFIYIIHDEIVKVLRDEIIKRFDTNIKFYKLDENKQTEFVNFIDERIIPKLEVDYELIWNKISSIQIAINNIKDIKK